MLISVINKQNNKRMRMLISMNNKQNHRSTLVTRGHLVFLSVFSLMYIYKHNSRRLQNCRADITLQI